MYGGRETERENATRPVKRNAHSPNVQDYGEARTPKTQLHILCLAHRTHYRIRDKKTIVFLSPTLSKI